MRKILKYKSLILLYWLFIFVTLPLLTNCSDKQEEKGNSEFKGTIRISGAFALYPLVVKWGEEFEKLHPQVKVDVSAGGAGKGVIDALHNHVNLGMVSRDVHKEEISKGAWGVTVAKDAVIPTVNAENPYLNEILSKGMSKEEFYKLWISEEIKTWGEVLGTKYKEPIRKFKRSDASGAGETWANFMDKKEDDLKGVGVMGDPGLAHAVLKDKYAVGFNNIAYVYDLKTQKPIDGLRVIPIDLNSDGKIDSLENFYETHQKLIEAIGQHKFPAPPARELFFVSNGPPKDKLVIEFFKWILNDGQKFVPEMGYLKLSPDYVKAEVETIESYLPKE